MATPSTAPSSNQQGTYTRYSVGCAVVWAVILAAAQRRLDPSARKALWVACGGWWSGWTSATIARVSYPPPKPLKPRTHKRLAAVSVVLVAAGLINVIRLLAIGQPTARSTNDS